VRSEVKDGGQRMEAGLVAASNDHEDNDQQDEGDKNHVENINDNINDEKNINTSYGAENTSQFSPPENHFESFFFWVVLGFGFLVAALVSVCIVLWDLLRKQRNDRKDMEGVMEEISFSRKEEGQDGIFKSSKASSENSEPKIPHRKLSVVEDYVSVSSCFSWSSSYRSLKDMVVVWKEDPQTRIYSKRCIEKCEKDEDVVVCSLV